MDERGKGRSRDSRSESGSESGRGMQGKTGSSTSERSQGRYHDTFFEDMLIPEEDERREERSFSSRIGAENSSAGRSRRSTDTPARTRFIDEPEAKSGSGVNDDEVDGEDKAPASVRRRHMSRDEGEGEGEGQPKRRAKGRKLPTKVLGALVAIIVLVGIGAAFAYVASISANLHAGIDDDLRDALVETDMANEPFYMLLLGTDRSQDRADSGDFGEAYRSDSMMLARVDAPARKITLISIPRDIPVDFGGDIGKQKINAAYTIGGPSLAVKAVSELAGVDISHYAEIDFDGFVSLVDSLGGVEVDVPVYINDDDAGGVVQAGYQTLDGSQALILCRSRNTYANGGDHMRAANQRLVLTAIAKKVLSSDISTIAYSVQVMSQYVSTDLELSDIVGLAQAMSDIDTSADMYTATVPTTSQYVDGVWYDFVDKEEWAAMMDRVKEGLPPVEETMVDEETGTIIATAGTAADTEGRSYCAVTVKNATDREGLAAVLREELVAAGYVNVVIGDVNDAYSYPDTLVVYDDANRKEEAQGILDAVGQGELYYDEAGEYNMMYTDFIVVIGEDWES